MFHRQNIDLNWTTFHHPSLITRCSKWNASFRETIFFSRPPCLEADMMFGCFSSYWRRRWSRCRRWCRRPTLPSIATLSSCQSSYANQKWRHAQSENTHTTSFLETKYKVDLKKISKWNGYRWRRNAMNNDTSKVRGTYSVDFTFNMRQKHLYFFLMPLKWNETIHK